MLEHVYRKKEKEQLDLFRPEIKTYDEKEILNHVNKKKSYHN